MIDKRTVILTDSNFTDYFPFDFPESLVATIEDPGDGVDPQSDIVTQLLAWIESQSSRSPDTRYAMGRFEAAEVLKVAAANMAPDRKLKLATVRSTLTATTWAFGLLGLLGVLPAMMSPMMMDSPQASRDPFAILLFLAVGSFPFVCFTTVIASWRLYRKGKFVRALWVSVLPSANVLFVVVFFTMVLYSLDFANLPLKADESKALGTARLLTWYADPARTYAGPMATGILRRVSPQTWEVTLRTAPKWPGADGVGLTLGKANATGGYADRRRFRRAPR